MRHKPQSYEIINLECFWKQQQKKKKKYINTAQNLESHNIKTSSSFSW